MAYELFEKKAYRVNTPTLGVTTDGRIALNAAAVRLFRKTGSLSVLLLWNSNENKIALRATSKGDKNAYAISTTRQSGNIAAKSFLRHIGWHASKRTLLNVTWNEKAKMLEAKLPTRAAKAPAGSVKTGEH